MNQIPVLDHGHIGLFEHMGSDLSIVRNARVSYNAEWRAGEDAGKDEKLIRYLLKHRHTSPLESVTFTFDIKCPIFVARQWHRHRTWSYNEVSARYAQLPEEFYVPRAEHVGVQGKDNKQMRVVSTVFPVGKLPTDPIGMSLLATAIGKQRTEERSLMAEASAFVEALQQHSALGFAHYRNHLAAGIPRELARCFLGLNTYTHFFATVDLHNLLHFLNLRLHEHAQYEIRVYAEAIVSLIEPVVPVTIAAWRELNA